MILQSIFNIKYWKKEKYNKSLFFFNNVCVCVCIRAPWCCSRKLLAHIPSLELAVWVAHVRNSSICLVIFHLGLTLKAVVCFLHPWHLHPHGDISPVDTQALWTSLLGLGDGWLILRRLLGSFRMTFVYLKHILKVWWKSAWISSMMH